MYVCVCEGEGERGRVCMREVIHYSQVTVKVQRLAYKGQSTKYKVHSVGD